MRKNFRKIPGNPPTLPDIPSMLPDIPSMLQTLGSQVLTRNRVTLTSYRRKLGLHEELRIPVMSRWNDIARRVIADTLATIPPGTPPHLVRKIVSAAYPFGERAMFPYKCWLVEVRKALGPAKKEEKQKPVPTVKYRLDTTNLSVGGCLSVWCDWCRNRHGQAGCMMCFKMWKRCEEIIDNLEFQSLWVSHTQDSAVLPILGDWLEEHLGDRCGV